jgi:hypothetical protein
MQKNLSTVAYVAFTLLIASCSLSYTCTPELDPEIEALLDQDVLELEAPLPNQQTCYETFNIISLLTPPSPFNILPILMEDIYKKTTGPVTRRSLLDEPALMPDHFYNPCLTVTADLFYNFSPKVFFTKNSPFINSYIALNNQNIINELSDKDFITVNVPGILGLFSTIKLQQHRAGLMAGVGKQWDNWYLSVRMPLYYMLENFYLTQEEIDAIENNPFFETDDGGEAIGPEEEVRKFALKHLVGDKFGVGDARLSLLGHIYKSPCKNLWFGLQATIPTSKTFVRGLLGGEFDPDEPIPPFNLQHFFNVFFCNNNEALAQNVIRTELTDFLVEALDRLSTILINAPLGNGKHFGFGPEIDFRYTINEYASMHTYASLEAYTPHHEHRYYLVQKQPSDFDRDWENEALAGENLSVLNRLIVNTLFPVGIVTTVRPGFRFQFNHAFMYKSKHWDAKVGFDYWYQGKEDISPLLDRIPCVLPINIAKAKRPAAQQGKLFANIGYCDTLCSNAADWYVSLILDGTVFNKGIGENYTVGVRVGFEF